MMEKIDLEYICRAIGNLSGIPIRIYKKRSLSYYYSVVPLPADPIAPYIERVLDIEENIGYFTTPYFNYYGIVNSRHGAIIIGPSRQTSMNENDMRSLAFECGVDSLHTDEFIAAMKVITQMPLGSIIQIICAINYVINGEKLTLEDVSIFDIDQANIESEIEKASIEKSYDEYAPREMHNTLVIEQSLMQMITEGDVGALYEWLSRAPSVRGGIIANDALRQLKNTFIVTSTLASRAAIKGGMDAEDALSLSDDYIKKCELLSTYEAIINLQYHMVLDYTKRVERIRIGKNPSRLLMQVTNYAQHNLSKPMDISALADSMFISRTHLAAKFKKETGITLTEFILKGKIEEAKRLICYSDKSLSLIAEYLGFSSQSHFSRVFRKYVGITPGEYRKTHYK